jgi:hypothetical protein
MPQYEGEGLCEVLLQALATVAGSLCYVTRSVRSFYELTYTSPEGFPFFLLPAGHMCTVNEIFLAGLSV